MKKAGSGNRTRLLGLENQYNDRYTIPALIVKLLRSVIASKEQTFS